MAVYTDTKTYHTKAHMGMIDITGDFQDARPASSPVSPPAASRA